jgi:hypothetical protein
MQTHVIAPDEVIAISDEEIAAAAPAPMLSLHAADAQPPVASARSDSESCSADELEAEERERSAAQVPPSFARNVPKAPRIDQKRRFPGHSKTCKKAHVARRSFL